MHYCASGLSVRSRGPVTLPCLCSHPLHWALPFVPALIVFCLRKTLFWTWILVLPLHNSTNHSAHHLILPCCGFWARLQGKKGCEPTSDGLWFGRELRKGQKVTVKAFTSICLSNISLEEFLFFFCSWAMAGEGRMTSTYPRAVPRMLGYVGWPCSEATAEHFYVQSEKSQRKPRP